MSTTHSMIAKAATVFISSVLISGSASWAAASGGASGSRAQSLTNRLWQGLSAHVYVFLHQTRLSDVVENQMTPCPAVPNLFAVVDE